MNEYYKLYIKTFYCNNIPFSIIHKMNAYLLDLKFIYRSPYTLYMYIRFVIYKYYTISLKYICTLYTNFTIISLYILIITR